MASTMIHWLPASEIPLASGGTRKARITYGDFQFEVSVAQYAATRELHVILPVFVELPDEGRYKAFENYVLASYRAEAARG